MQLLRTFLAGFVKFRFGLAWSQRPLEAVGFSLRHLWLYVGKCSQSWTNVTTKWQFRFGLRKTKPTTITKEKFSLWMLEGDQGPGREGDGRRPPETAVCPREFSLPGRLQSFSPGRQLTKLVNQDGISSLSKSVKTMDVR